MKGTGSCDRERECMGKKTNNQGKRVRQQAARCHQATRWVLVISSWIKCAYKRIHTPFQTDRVNTVHTTTPVPHIPMNTTALQLLFNTLHPFKDKVLSLITRPPPSLLGLLLHALLRIVCLIRMINLESIVFYSVANMIIIIIIIIIVIIII